MTLNEWVDIFHRISFRTGKNSINEVDLVLLKQRSEPLSDSMQELLNDMAEGFARYFFSKATKGETFGPLGNIYDAFGKTLEENYGLTEGPFVNLAKTYWTYRFAVDEFPSNNTDTYLYYILRQFEVGIAGLFFPTPGRATVPLEKRIETQKQMLQQYAPSIDIQRFIVENPILRKESTRQGCFGSLLLAMIILCLLLYVGYQFS